MNLEILKKLPLKEADYILYPDRKYPRLIFPVSNKKVFLKALNMYKSIGILSLIKKTLLQVLPIWLLKMIYPLALVGSKDGSGSGLIIPWVHFPDEKFTILIMDKDYKPERIIKCAFSEKASKMLQNENIMLEYLKNNIKQGNISFPKVISFKKRDNITYLTIDYFFGDYAQKQDFKKIEDFFNKLVKKENFTLKEHPYIRKVLSKFEKYNKNITINSLINMLDKYSNEIYPLSLMHGDLGPRNIIKTPNKKIVIIDWEEGDINGIPLDIKYMIFRKEFDSKKSYKIKDSLDLLCALHYAFIIISKENFSDMKHLSIIKENIIWN